MSRVYRKILTVAAALSALLWADRTEAQSPACFDLAIVLAVDGSGSINADEFRLQKTGITSALRDPSVQHAIERAGTVAISVLYWGDATGAVQETPFVTVAYRQDLDLLIAAIERMPRRVFGNTGLSMGLSAALDKLEGVECAYRSVINISGDGRDSVVPRQRRLVPSLREVKARANHTNTIINALVISSEEPELKSYFQKQVITGPDAFVMEINGFDDYADALRRKLIREIAPVAVTEK